MRVKALGVWIEAEAGEPIMVELTEADRRNIADMHPGATQHALFADDETMTREERHAWMDEGAGEEALARDVHEYLVEHGPTHANVVLEAFRHRWSGGSASLGDMVIARGLAGYGAGGYLAA